MRQPFAVGATLAMLALALAGCAAQAETQRVFTSVNIAEPESLDPAYDYETAGGGVLQNVYDTLVYYNRGSAEQLLPVLLTEVPTFENGGLSADGLTYTLHLKRGVHFTDGNELTAEDVKYSLDRPVLMNDPNSPAWINGDLRGATAYMASDGTALDRAAYLAQGAVQVLDTYTVQVNLERANPAFLYKISYTQGSIVSSKAFKAPHAERVESWGVATTPDGLPPPAANRKKAVTRDPWADRNMVGTGPFYLFQWLPGDKVILKANPNFAGTPKPSLDVVIISKVTDLNTRILLLQRHDADDIYVGPSEVYQVQGKPFARIVEAPSFVIDTGVFTRHVTNPQECPVDAATNAPDCDFFSDVHARRAVALSFDYDKFLRDVMKGHATKLSGVVPRGMVGYDASLPPPAQDLAAARAELAASKHPNGFKLHIYYNAGNAPREGAAVLLKQGLEALSPNIQVSVQPLDWATALLPTAKKSGFAMYFIGWSPDYAFPDDYTKPFGDPSAGQYAKWAQMDIAQLNGLIGDAAKAVGLEEAKQKYADVQEFMHDDASYLYLMQRNNVNVEGTWTRGYFYNPMDSNQPLVGQYKFLSKV